MNCLHNNQNMMNNLIRSELLWEPLQSMKTDVSVSVPNTGTSNSPISSPTRSTSSVLRFSSSNSARRYSQDSTGSASSPMGNSRNSFGPSPTSQRMARAGSKKTVRKISRIPYKVLDAPALQVISAFILFSYIIALQYNINSTLEIRMHNTVSTEQRQ